ncbi:hypothetical protein Pint_22742 [Pistacia integerrima]|uniref:Uncharacterized protein n=1 Tax=Pistacia integerrima TaxID=434235 RepID=A0ACC0YM24_9ROSI|nr:hypothetical protein Pint_22742 [Pistacia integerrima]
MWKKYELRDVMMNDRGFFFFKFADESLMENCLEDGPCLSLNHPIMIQKWKPGMELNKETPRFIPMWVKFYDLLLEMWNPMGLSYKASGVGKTLHMDRVTQETCRHGLGHVGFARILVEVDAAKKLLDIVHISVPYDESIELKTMVVRLDYQWRPTQCPRCCVFGHRDVLCPRKPRVVINSNDKVVEENQIEKKGFTLVTRKGKEKVHDVDGDLGDTEVDSDTASIMEFIKHGATCSQAGCRIVMGWDPESFMVELLERTNQVILCLVRNLIDNGIFLYSIVYEANDCMSRHDLWKNLISHKLLVRDSPWIIMGEFNVILNSWESLGGNSNITTSIRDFRDCVNTLEVEDISQAGIMFTWNGKSHDENGIFKKLDRVMGNSLFSTKFLRVSTFFYPRGVSDHSILVTSFPSTLMTKCKPFKFFNYPTYMAEFKPIV